MRSEFLPYCLPSIGEAEVQEVADSLRSGWVTTGPKVKRFEADFARYAGVTHAIAVSSCTAALHVALAALDIGPGDEVIVPTLTFCATANVAIHLGATPVVVDVDRDYQISRAAVEAAITSRTRAIIPVHYAGQACDLDELRTLAGPRGIEIVEDAAHAAGSEYRGRKIGGHSRAAAFSFYATKNMTTGEGGMITTDDDALAARMRLLTLHGMSHDAWRRYSATGSWYYEVVEAGYKNNMTDIQAAMGIHQLRALDGFIARRREIAHRYGEAFAGMEEIVLPRERPDRNHTYHLYPIRLRPNRLSIDRQQFIDALREANIGTSVHFIPLHRHPLYQRKYGYRPEQFPVAEEIYSGLLSLPLYPKMSDTDVEDVIEAVRVTAARGRIAAPGWLNHVQI
jgi:dTDP-4-amino-4,6-dideoxygalactose transaminase